MIPETPPSTLWLEIVTAVGALVSVLGVVAEHFWARRKIDKVQRRSDNHRDIEVPIREELARLADFGADILDWESDRGGQNPKVLVSKGIRVSRKLNQTINIIAKNPHTSPVLWVSISTENFDGALSSLSEKTKLVSVKALSGEVDRIESRLLEALAQLSA